MADCSSRCASSRQGGSSSCDGARRGIRFGSGIMILRSLEALNRAPWWRTPVATWGGRFQPPSADRLAYLWLHKLGIMGRDRALLEAQVQPGMVVADIGANVGLYTYLLARCAGERGFVYAFEPNPALFASLETNCRTNERRQCAAPQCRAGRTRRYADADTLALQLWR